ncbi:MAG: Cytochrome c, class I [Halomonas sp. 54_146]|nr:MULTISPECIES: cytochrome c [unclassified Halomonas]KUJ87077.1 MAG: Cytochrome c, class I [Halomonas sp. 54_146]
MLSLRYLSAFVMCLFLTASPPGLAAGDELFQQSCGGCHGAGALGVPGLAPSLKNPDLWGSLEEDALRYLVGVVTSGMSGKLEVNGQVFQGMAMPPMRQINSKSLTSIADYVLSGVNGLTVTPSESTVIELQSEPMDHGSLRELRSAGGGDER